MSFPSQAARRIACVVTGQDVRVTDNDGQAKKNTNIGRGQRLLQNSNNVFLSGDIVYCLGPTAKMI